MQILFLHVGFPFELNMSSYSDYITYASTCNMILELSYQVSPPTICNALLEIINFVCTRLLHQDLKRSYFYALIMDKTQRQYDIH